MPASRKGIAMRTLRWVWAVFSTFTLWLACQTCIAAEPTVAQALDLRPIQTEVDYDRPDAAASAKCTLKAEPSGTATGWVVRNADGGLLRRFLDTNADGKIDRWCYYKEGIEIYRDIDADFNGKADQYRWLGTAGTRWGQDRNENGAIDIWNSISAEEVSAEVVAALRTGDAERFGRLVLQPNEVGALGLDDAQTRQLRQRIERARNDFASLAKSQQIVKKDTQWIHFGATQPGVVPEGTNGSKKDLVVYENVVAVIETSGTHGQVPIGTLIKVGDAWRAIDLPVNSPQGQGGAEGGFFFASARGASATPASTTSSDADAWQPWIAKLEEVDQKLLKATTPGEQAKLNALRADVIQRLIEAMPENQRDTWIRQLADTVSAATQSGQYPGGVARLEDFFKQIDRQSDDATLRGYVKFRWISAEYGQRIRDSMNDKNADIAKIQTKWLGDLTDYVREFPRTPDAAEAMLQLAIAEEFALRDSEAERWYRRIVSEFPKDRRAEKAAGALRRLGSVGQSITFSGKSTTGQTISLEQLKGKTVLVHYWATWCEPCKEEFKTLKELQKKYQSQGFTLVGVSLDSDAAALKTYLKTNPLPWPQLYETGGLDSRLANELGILTLPTMLLVDKTGKVVNRAAVTNQLDAELEKLFK
jgi:thiol-disulfide isomerase/thioredoxin